MTFVEDPSGDSINNELFEDTRDFNGNLFTVKSTDDLTYVGTYQISYLVQLELWPEV